MKLLKSQFTRTLTLIGLLMLSGCYISSRTTTFRELEQTSNQKYPIRALTVDSTLYTFDTFAFTDSTLSGKGSWKKNGSMQKFEGTLKFSNIVLIERIHSNYWKAFWIIPMTVAIIGGISQISQPSEFNIRRPIGGSCPFIYSFNGTDFILEAEAFSTAVSRSMETQTFHVLPSLATVKNKLTIRIKNERPETHMINSVHLYTADSRNGSSVVLDTENNLWTVKNALPPVKASDHSGRDVLKLLSKKDGLYWKSDLNNMSGQSKYRDTLYVQFTIPGGKHNATLIVDAINTDLMTLGYRFASTILGDESLKFYRALDEDTELKKLVQEGIQKSSLLVEIWNGKNWEKVGTIPPAADVVPFTRAVRLNNPDHLISPLKVRLSSMTDVWHINTLSIDFNQDRPLTLYPLELTSVKASNHGTNLKENISKSDSSYVMLLPPEYMDMTFAATTTYDIQNPVYVLTVRGYLYEWIPDAKDITAPVFPGWLNDMDRVELLKYFVRHEDILFPQVYAKWIRVNQK